MEEEIVKVDRQYRLRLMTFYLLTLAVVGISLYAGVPHLLQWLRSLDFNGLLLAAELLTIGPLMLFALPGIYLIVVGRRVLRHGRSPYPGMKVIRDTRVVTGRRAVWRGRALVTLGVVGLAMAVLGSLATHLVLVKFKHDMQKQFISTPVV